MNNHQLRFRPLRSGIAVLNPRLGEPGTIGLIAKSADGAQWVVSCYHVLVRLDRAPSVDGEPIYQPAVEAPDALVAMVSAARTNADADIAAARLSPAIQGLWNALGIGRLGRPCEAEEGMHVIKSGAVTGVTEGIITLVDGSRIEIATANTFPEDYALSQGGDSGSVWLTSDGHCPVALHLGSRGPGCAKAVAVTAALTQLGLTPLE